VRKVCFKGDVKVCVYFKGKRDVAKIVFETKTFRYVIEKGRDILYFTPSRELRVCVTRDFNKKIIKYIVCKGECCEEKTYAMWSRRGRKMSSWVDEIARFLIDRASV